MLFGRAAEQLSMSQPPLSRSIAAFEREVWLWFFAGILAQRWKDRNRAPAWKPLATTR